MCSQHLLDGGRAPYWPIIYSVFALRPVTLFLHDSAFLSISWSWLMSRPFRLWCDTEATGMVQEIINSRSKVLIPSPFDDPWKNLILPGSLPPPSLGPHPALGHWSGMKTMYNIIPTRAYQEENLCCMWRSYTCIHICAVHTCIMCTCIIHMCVMTS